MQTCRVLGIDLGRRYVVYAVIDERLLTAGVWQFPPETPALLLPALVRQRAQTLLRRYRVEVLAIEDWVWHGRFVSEASSVTRLIGALETLASQVLVVEYPAGEWMRALMGSLPSADPYGWEDEAAVVAFELRGRQVKFVLPLPSKASRAFTYTPGRRRLRTPEQVFQAWEQATRQCWRALALIIKAKLEAVASGVTTFEGEFSSRFMLPDGNMVGEWLHPQLVRAYETHRMPPMLPLPEQHA